MGAYSGGERVTLTVTGTVETLTPDEQSALGVNFPGHEFVLLTGDTGGRIVIDITGGLFPLTDAKPQYWPVQPKDVWQAGEKTWYAYEIDTGSRKALRLVHYTATGEIVRSQGVFLKQNPSAVLVRRNGVRILENI